MRARHLSAAIAVLVIAFAGCGGGSGSEKKAGPAPSDAPTITIGTKNFTEQFILGELYKQALEASGFKVSLKSDIGSSEIVDRALTAGSLDMYPEYIGVALSELAGRTARPSSRADAYRRAQGVGGGPRLTPLAAAPVSPQDAPPGLPPFAEGH